MDNFIDLAQTIKLLILDLDGVCTDGGLYFTAEGESIKRFHVHDGLGIKLLMKTGVEVAVISAKDSLAAEVRMKDLGVKHIYLGYERKLPAYEALLKATGLTDEQVAYMGDDLPDLCLINRVKLGISVPNAIDQVKKQADFVTKAAGGFGAVREVCEYLMRAQGTFDDVLAMYK